MTIKKTKVVTPKVGYLGFDIVEGYIDDFGYTSSEREAQKDYMYYLKVENWPDPDKRPPGKCLATVKL